MNVTPRLSRELVASLATDARVGVDVPPARAIGLPERVVQFGTGAFLRGFAEYFIDQANRRGSFNGSIVAISSTGSQRDALLNEQDGLFTLAIQGMEGNVANERHCIVSSLSRALSARDEWDAVLAVARNPSIELVLSNTTEVGIVLDDDDTYDARPPRSFPGKLTRFLDERAKAFDYEVGRGLIILPCELIEANGDTLRSIVGELARRWRLGSRFEQWLNEGVTFCNTLVDRIVPGLVMSASPESATAVYGYRDDLLTACETYALFAIEGDDALSRRLTFSIGEPRIIVTPDIRPYRERKVRVLNGAHTALVATALLAGAETVHDAVVDERVGRFMRRVVFDDIVTSLDVPDADGFAHEVIERFANPYIRHALIDITLYGTTKMRVRVVPSIVAYAARTGRAPSSLAFGFAAYLAFMRGELQRARVAAGLAVPEDSEGERVRAAWQSVDVQSDVSIADLVQTVCTDRTLWGADLAEVPGFAEAVSDHLIRIIRQGVELALDAHLTETALT